LVLFCNFLNYAKYDKILLFFHGTSLSELIQIVLLGLIANVIFYVYSDRAVNGYWNTVWVTETYVKQAISCFIFGIITALLCWILSPIFNLHELSTSWPLSNNYNDLRIIPITLSACIGAITARCI